MGEKPSHEGLEPAPPISSKRRRLVVVVGEPVDEPFDAARPVGFLKTLQHLRDRPAGRGTLAGEHRYQPTPSGRSRLRPAPLIDAVGEYVEITGIPRGAPHATQATAKPP